MPKGLHVLNGLGTIGMITTTGALVVDYVFSSKYKIFIRHAKAFRVQSDHLDQGSFTSVTNATATTAGAFTKTSNQSYKITYFM